MNMKTLIFYITKQLFWSKQEFIYKNFQNNFLCIYFVLKYRFCAHLSKICPIVLKLALDKDFLTICWDQMTVTKVDIFTNNSKYFIKIFSPLSTHT